MLLEFDLILWLAHSPHTPQSLAGGLRTEESNVGELLDSLRAERLIQDAAAASGASWISIPRLTPEAKRLYGPVLERTPDIRPDLVVLGTIERFILALSDRTPIPFRRSTLKLLDDVPLGEEDKNARLDIATALADTSIRCAELALESGGEAMLAEALGRVPRHCVEELVAVAALLDDYAEQLADPRLKSVVERASLACTKAWDLRPMTKRDPKTLVSTSREQSDPTSHLRVAEEAGLLLRELGRAHPGFEPISEARSIITRCAPSAPATAGLE